MLITTTAHAKTPQWVTNLTNHDAVQKVSPQNREDVTCLALAIYFEARGETTKGQQAVGNVVMNRVKSKRYPETVCGVLFEKGQFSFLRKSAPAVPKASRPWENAVSMARDIIRGTVADVSGGATSFCQRRLRKTGNIIGNHIFYR